MIAKLFRSSIFVVAVALGTTTCLIGCGGGDSDNPATVPVNGKVTWNGKPLTTGRVQFVPDDPQKGRPAVGDLDDSGNFTLSTFQPDDGVIPGSYKIMVIAFSYAADDVLEKNGTPILPEKYSDAQTSGLAEVIAESDGEKNVDLVLEGTR